MIDREIDIKSCQRFPNYSAFFPHYLSEHKRPATRAFHYLGTVMEGVSVIAFILTFNPVFLLTALVGGYGFAWMSHALIERNKPATFTYPVWSYFADHHMAYLAITGVLNARLKSEAQNAQK